MSRDRDFRNRNYDLLLSEALKRTFALVISPLVVVGAISAPVASARKPKKPRKVERLTPKPLWVRPVSESAPR